MANRVTPLFDEVTPFSFEKGDRFHLVCSHAANQVVDDIENLTLITTANRKVI